MSNNNGIINKNKTKKKKKRNEMSLEDYVKQNNLSISIKLNYEGEEEMPKYITKFNKNNKYETEYNTPEKEKNLKIKNEEKNYDNSSKTSLLSQLTELKKYPSSSTKESSLDNDNDINTSQINQQIKDIIKNHKIKDYVSQKNIPPIINSINNNPTNNTHFQFPQNNNTFIKNNNSSPCINIYNNNININNDYDNYFNNQLYINYNNMKNNYTILFKRMVDNYKSNINNIDEKINQIVYQIKDIANRRLIDIFLFNQKKYLINFIKKQNSVKCRVKNDNSKEPELPFFYPNHNEENFTKFILYLIEGLFNKDNLKQDFFLLTFLNRDGYASLKQLEMHPQLKAIGVNESKMKNVFLEHRMNEITETVETFDDILIRNKEWIKIKKIINKDLVYKNEMNRIQNMQNCEIQNLFNIRNNLFEMKNKIILQFKANCINTEQSIKLLYYNFIKIINSINFNYDINNNYTNKNNTFHNVYNMKI
jgi:hypothetical protein